MRVPCAPPGLEAGKPRVPGLKPEAPRPCPCGAQNLNGRSPCHAFSDARCGCPSNCGECAKICRWSEFEWCARPFLEGLREWGCRSAGLRAVSRSLEDMSARFAGSRSLDERRRRRLAAGAEEPGPSGETAAACGRSAAEGGRRLAPRVPLQKIISPRGWKVWLVVLAAYALGAGVLLAGAGVSRWERARVADEEPASVAARPQSARRMSRTVNA